MLSLCTRRLIYVIISVTLLNAFFYLNDQGISITSRDLSQADLFEKIVETNSLWSVIGEEARFEKLTNIPAYANASNKIAVNEKTKTIVCETDPFIGQQVLCGLQEKSEEKLSCDSDSLQYYADFNEMKRKQRLDANFTSWKILFPTRDPIEKFVDHYMDVCVREERPCFNCRLDLRCYLMRVYTELITLHQKNLTVDDDQKKYVPQNWFCNMKTMNQRFTLVDYTLFGKPSNPEYAEAERPDRMELDDILADSLSSYKKISKFYTAFIYSRPDVLDLFIKIYYWDYRFLNKPLPKLKLAEARDYKDGWF